MPDYLVGLASWVAQFLLERLEERPFEAGNFLVGLVGVPVLIWHVRGVHKGIETQTRNIQAQTLGCLYNHYFTLCRTLLRRPHLRGYLYDDVALRAYPANDKLRSQVNTVCEMTTGLLEHAVLQRLNIPEGSWRDCWQPYLKEMYKNRNSELALFFRKNRHFYSTDFQDVVDPLIATKNDTSAAPRQTVAPEASPAGAPHNPG
jgi:hypothetical protein